MKKIIFTLVIALVTLIATAQTNPSNPFFHVSVVADTLVHLVWENPDEENVNEIIIEESADGINFRSLATAAPASLTDIHSLNYPKYIDYFNHILKSSESGNTRYIYNDIVKNKNFTEKKILYRIKTIAFSGKENISQTKSAVAEKFENNANEKTNSLSNETNWNGSKLKGGGEKPGCPSVGTPQTGWPNTGITQTFTGQCCIFEQTLYKDPNSINCPLAWCCYNVPGAVYCPSGYASDPCCVHQCWQYYQSSCVPWICCTYYTPWVVTQSVELPPLSITPTIINETNPGANDGSISIIVTNATVPVSYTWAPSGSGSTLTNLPAGTYSVTVNDAHACTATGVFIVNTINTQTASSNSPICEGSTLNLFSDGGLNYQWSGPNGFTSGLQNPVIAVAAPVNSGLYMVTVTDSVGNSATAQTTVVINPAPVLSYTITNVSCSSNSDGAIDLSVSACTPLSYAWSNGAVTEDLSGLPSGNYCVTVTCAGSCQANVCIMIIQPPPVPIITFPTVNLLCYGDSFNMCALAGNNPPYTYLWNTGDTAKCIYATAGTYSVTVTDSSGCTQTEGGTITQPASPLTAGIIKTDLKCYGVCTGMATGNAGGGTPPYSYQWSNGMTGDTLYNLCAGTYTCTVSDANACTASASVTITQPPYCPPPVLYPVHVLCYGECTGEIDMMDSCISPYNHYLWNNGDVTQDLYGLCAGYYSVTVTDSAGCQRTAWTIINQPSAPLADSIIPKNVSCHDGNDGDIDLIIFGGTPPYSIIWSPAGDTTEDLHNIFLGTNSIIFIVTITDANGCTLTDSVTLSQPHAPLTATITGVNIQCNGDLTGSIDITPSGGTPFYNSTYSYQWNNSEIIPDLSGIPAGNYCVTITDAQGCDTVYCITITEPPPLVVSLSPVNTTCYNCCDGAVISTVTGGIPFMNGGYSYLWSTSPQQTSPDIAQLCAGTYIITVTDSAGCAVTNVATVSTTGIASQNLNSAIEIFPNPVNNTLYIKTELAIQQTEITDIIGRTILQTNKKVVSFSEYPAGVYLIRITTDRGEVVKKFVKE